MNANPEFSASHTAKPSTHPHPPLSTHIIINHELVNHTLCLCFHMGLNYCGSQVLILLLITWFQSSSAPHGMHSWRCWFRRIFHGNLGQVSYYEGKKVHVLVLSSVQWPHQLLHHPYNSPLMMVLINGLCDAIGIFFFFLNFIYILMIFPPVFDENQIGYSHKTCKVEQVTMNCWI